MQKVPYAERAEVSIHKLRDYCLSSTHEEGRIKAAAFASRLGMLPADRLALRALLQQAVQSGEASLRVRDQYGQRYAVDFLVEWKGRRAAVRSGWILERGSDTPRLTSCFVL